MVTMALGTAWLRGRSPARWPCCPTSRCVWLFGSKSPRDQDRHPRGCSSSGRRLSRGVHCGTRNRRHHDLQHLTRPDPPFQSVQETTRCGSHRFRWLGIRPWTPQPKLALAEAASDGLRHLPVSDSEVVIRPRFRDQPSQAGLRGWAATWGRKITP